MENKKLLGKWGGEWEFLSIKYIDDPREPNRVQVRSIRTGYTTEMREDSFVR